MNQSLYERDRVDKKARERANRFDVPARTENKSKTNSNTGHRQVRNSLHSLIKQDALILCTPVACRPTEVVHSDSARCMRVRNAYDTSRHRTVPHNLADICGHLRIHRAYARVRRCPDPCKILGNVRKRTDPHELLRTCGKKFATVHTIQQVFGFCVLKRRSSKYFWGERRPPNDIRTRGR